MTTWFFTRGPSAEATARDFASALRAKDWAYIYDLASEEEKRRQRWNREQFVTLMRELSYQTLQEIGDVSMVGYMMPTGTSKNFHMDFSVTRPNGKTERVNLVISVYRSAKDWHPQISNLPLRLHNLNKETTKDSLKRLVAACDVAGIGAFGRLDDHLEVSVDGIKEYLAGKKAWNDAVYRPRPGY